MQPRVLKKRGIRRDQRVRKFPVEVALELFRLPGDYARFRQADARRRGGAVQARRVEDLLGRWTSVNVPASLGFSPACRSY
jgi:hypothetical protein